VLVVGCLALAILRLQGRLLGDPLSTLRQLVAPHNH